jgi:hypothetical protein
MNIIMNKKQETSDYVEYQFSTTIAGESYINERGRERVRLETKEGICTFNKITGDFHIDQARTDYYFNNRSSEKVMMYGKLKKYQGLDFFPDIIHIATG